MRATASGACVGCPLLLGTWKTERCRYPACADPPNARPNDDEKVLEDTARRDRRLGPKFSQQPKAKRKKSG